ncbi:flagellar export chaperone FlgN [Dyella koreensis]
MLKQALEELDGEVSAYRRLSSMLDKQFQVATRLDTASLACVSEAIAQEVHCLEGRRRQRSQLLTVASTLANRLPAARGTVAHRAVEQRCTELKELATICKAATLRNGQLLASQYDAMQRVLQGERHTYAPA